MNQSLQSLLRESAAQRQEIDAVLGQDGDRDRLNPGASHSLPSPSTAKPPQEVVIMARPGESAEAALARVCTSPFVPAAATVCDFMKKGGMPVAPLPAVIEQLERQAQNASDGNLTHAEAVLTTQAATLDAVFNMLARRAAATIEKSGDATERYLRMALKAQTQCRATLETLATIKAGPVVFARQANINNGGQQQVNNGTGAGAPNPAPRTRTRGKGKESGSNELSAPGAA